MDTELIVPHDQQNASCHLQIGLLSVNMFVTFEWYIIHEIPVFSAVAAGSEIQATLMLFLILFIKICFLFIKLDFIALPS